MLRYKLPSRLLGNIRCIFLPKLKMLGVLDLAVNTVMKTGIIWLRIAWPCLRMMCVCAVHSLFLTIQDFYVGQLFLEMPVKEFCDYNLICFVNYTL